MLKEASLQSTTDLVGLQLARDGAQLYPRLLSEQDVALLSGSGEPLLAGKPGARIFGGPIARFISAADGPLTTLAIQLMGPTARAVRAILFDKTAEANWSVAWHQDRTIAVRERCDVAGYGPWSIKDGAHHVEPPFGVMRDMVTMRAHLDDCTDDNAPLMIALGSHDLGRVPTAEIANAFSGLATVRCLADAGDVWVYATPIIHASDRTRSAARRRVLQVDFCARQLPLGLEWLGVGG
ncbi:MAG TPA: phytanoyl-CoA dioxygenase family protein [Dongiaceae bacterium]|nr:phytanoyl-CoA dioxygenase family protein [Dongiaceae bacterium]